MYSGFTDSYLSYRKTNSGILYISQSRPRAPRMVPLVPCVSPGRTQGKIPAVSTRRCPERLYFGHADLFYET